MSDERDERDDLEFGPSGYLPERASKRARKIVLRAPLGMQWVWASVVAGVIVLVAGAIFLARAGAGPSAPFERYGPVAELGDASLSGDGRFLLVTVAGRPRAFDVADLPSPPVYCEASRLLEDRSGRAWTLTGRGLGGTPSLAEYPTRVFEGDLYVDLSASIAGPPASDEPPGTACAG